MTTSPPAATPPIGPKSSQGCRTRADRLWAVIVPLLVLAALTGAAGGGCRRTQGDLHGQGVPRLVEVSVEPGLGESTRPLKLGSAEPVGVSHRGFRLRLKLDPIPSRSWWETTPLVTCDHSWVAGVDFQGGGPVIELRGGAPGEVLTLSLASVRPSDPGGKTGPITFQFVEDLSAVLERPDGDGWRVPEAGEFIPDRPLVLRLSFSREMDREAVEERLAGLGASLIWTDGRTLGLTFPEPPPVIEFPESLPDVYGLTLRDPYRPMFVTAFPVIYAGDPPRLYAYDPGAGEETPLGELPVEVFRAEISPDGRQLLAEVFLNRSPNTATYVFEAATGTRKRIYFDAWGWLTDSTLLRAPWWTGASECSEVDTDGMAVRRVSLPDGWRSVAPSPDRRWLATLLIRDRDTEGVGDLAVFDLATGERKALVKEFVWETSWFMEDVFSYNMHVLAWSPDGTKIAAASYRRGAPLEIRVADLENGQVSGTTPPGDVGAFEAVSCPFTWSPDGRSWGGGCLFIMGTAPPHEGFSLDLPLATWHGWSPDGSWVAWGGGYEWGEITLRNQDTEEERSLGPGLPCGWHETGVFYFIRWAGGPEGFAGLG